MLIRSRALDRSRVTGVLLVMLLLASGGCIFSPDDDGPGDDVGPAPLPFPDTPDKLMTNFKNVYGGMDLVNYRDVILNPNYTFVLQDATVEQFGLPDNLFEYEDEVRIVDKMFSGQANSLGQVVAAIEIQSLQPQGAWLPVPDNDAYFGGVGALVRNYNTLIYFNISGDFRYEVRGDQLFYVVADTVMHDGVRTPHYTLLGQLDQTSITP